MKNITQLVSLEQQLNSTTVFSSCYIRSKCIQLNLSISENIVPGKPILSRRVRPIDQYAWILLMRGVHSRQRGPRESPKSHTTPYAIKGLFKILDIYQQQ